MILNLKKIYFLFFLFILAHHLMGQNKQDYVWLFSNNSTAEPGNEAYGFNFNLSGEDVIQAYPNIIEMEFSGNNASICDKNGNLLLYTNGCHVAGADHNILPNGSGLNEG